MHVGSYLTKGCQRLNHVEPDCDLAFKNISETDNEVNDEEDDYGYNHNQLIMADGCKEEEEEEDEWESMYVDE